MIVKGLETFSATFSTTLMVIYLFVCLFLLLFCATESKMNTCKTEFMELQKIILMF